MTAPFYFQAESDDQQLLAQVIAFYRQTLKDTPDALDHLRRRGITNAQAIDHFRIGYADRSLGRLLPSKDSKAGRQIRTKLETLGLFRQTGHEHFSGSVTFPILAADGSGRVVDIYGRKMLGERLRKGTALDLHLNDDKAGVWNVETFGTDKEIVLCSGLWDALTFWNHGYRNATCMFGPEALTQDTLAAFREFNVKRVLTPCATITQKLLEAGLEVFLLKLPPDVDVNAYALKVSDPADALGGLLRSAEWMGKPSATIPVPGVPRVEQDAGGAAGVVEADADVEDDDDALDELLDEEDEPEEDVVPVEPVIRTASPVPPAPAEVEAEVRDDEVVITFGNRRYRVRGLERNTALDVLRVNVLASNGTGMFIDTFDLYSARHRKAYQEQAAVELRVEEQTIKTDLGRLLLELEEVQDKRLREMLTPMPTQAEMPPEERAAALQLLRDPQLLDRIVDDFAVVGERTNKLVGYLAAVSRKLDQPLAIIIQSTSAAGKSTLMDAVLGFVPPEDVVKFSAMTGQSLYYLGDGSLKHKILAIVEEEGAAKASYALKLLQSEGELRIASTGKEASTGRLTTQEYRVEGPVMLFLTTTSISVDEELMNRCLVLTVNEDRDQTRAIHQIQRAKQTIAGLLAARQHHDTLKLHRNAQRLLRPLLVANPYAERLTFMDTTTRSRRDNQKYLTLIRTITLLRQHQRPVKTAEHGGKPVEYIEVTLEDIETANRLSAEVLGRSLDELPPQTRRLLDLIDGMVAEGCRSEGVERADFRFTARQLREHAGWGNTQLKIHLGRLVQMEYLLVHRDRDAKRFRYELLYEAPVGKCGKVLAGLIDVERLRQGQ